MDRQGERDKERQTDRQIGRQTESKRIKCNARRESDIESEIGRLKDRERIIHRKKAFK